MFGSCVCAAQLEALRHIVSQIDDFLRCIHHARLHKETASIGSSLPHLALRCALAVSPEAAGAAAGVPGARRLPGPLSGGPVVVEMPAAQVFVGLPVAKDVEGGAGGDGRQAGLRDLQLLEVSVDRRVGPALTCRRRCLVEERRKAERRSDHEQLFRILLKIGTSIFPCSSAHIP